MSLSNNSPLQQLGVAGAAAATVVALLSIKYHDRPLFYEHPKDIPHGTGYPLIGTLGPLLKNVYRLHDFQLEIFEKHNTQTM